MNNNNVKPTILDLAYVTELVQSDSISDLLRYMAYIKRKDKALWLAYAEHLASLGFHNLPLDSSNTRKDYE